MSATKYLQKFGEDAIYMSMAGWNFINPQRPGNGIYRAFKYKKYEVYVLIFPSTGYPIMPPIVIFLASSEEFFGEFEHPCLWSNESSFVINAPERLRSLLADPSYSKRFLHILEGKESFWHALKDAKNRLQIINDFLINTLNLKPIK
ncbi:MAG: hypothetical protein ABIM44_08425 [candidate division WOR-3 bacterium]